MAISISYIQNGENNDANVFNRPLIQLASEIDNTNEALNTAIVQAVPTGLITMWAGSIADVPFGWTLCDGTDGTPDLRNRFVVGAGDIYNVGVSGGSKDAVVVSHSHVGTVGEGGSHDHNASTNTSGVHYHRGATAVRDTNPDEKQAYARQGVEGSASGQAAAYQSPNATKYSVTSDAGGHSHTVDVDAVGNHTHSVSLTTEGESGTNKNLPPYYALAYIMKT